MMSRSVCTSLMLIIFCISLNAQILDKLYIEAGYNYSETINRGKLAGLDYGSAGCRKIIIDDTRARISNYNFGLGFRLSKYFGISMKMGRHNIARRIYGTLEFPGGADTFSGLADTIRYGSDLINNEYSGIYTEVLIPQPHGYTSLTIGYELHDFIYSNSRFLVFDQLTAVHSFHFELGYYYQLSDNIDFGLNIFFKDFYKKRRVQYFAVGPFTQRFIPKSVGVALSIKVRPFTFL